MKYTNNRHKSPPSPFSIYPHTKMPSLSLSLSLSHTHTHTHKQLDCAMGDGKIETPEYLRLVHKLSRQQFLEKELALKIIGKRRVLGVY